MEKKYNDENDEIGIYKAVEEGYSDDTGEKDSVAVSEEVLERLTGELDDEEDITLSIVGEDRAPVNEVDEDRFEEPQKFITAQHEVKYFTSKKKYAEAEKEKEELLKYWRRQKVKKIVIIAGVVTCLIGGAFALRNRKSSEAVATPVQTTEETTKSEDLNIPINGKGEDSAKSLEELIGDEPILEMPSNPELEETTQSETTIPETTVAETPAETKPAESQSAPSPESKKPAPETSAPAPTQAPQPTAPPQTAAPAEIESQVNEIQGAPVETIPQEAAQNMDDYYRSLAESLLAEPGAQERISELTSGGKDN